MTFRVFNVAFPGKQLRVTVYEMPDGKLEQYLVIARREVRLWFDETCFALRLAAQ